MDKRKLDASENVALEKDQPQSDFCFPLFVYNNKQAVYERKQARILNQTMAKTTR